MGAIESRIEAFFSSGGEPYKLSKEEKLLFRETEVYLKAKTEGKKSGKSVEIEPVSKAKPKETDKILEAAL